MRSPENVFSAKLFGNGNNLFDCFSGKSNNFISGSYWRLNYSIFFIFVNLFETWRKIFPNLGLHANITNGVLF